MYSLAIYLVDLAYGGPEEGGWYFTCGEIEAEVPALYFETEEEACTAREAAQGLLDSGWNAGRREISSVLSEGIFRAVVHERHPPQYFPAERPHYE